MNFLWSGYVLVAKSVMVKWHTCCPLLKEGGLGLWSLKVLSLAMLCKLAHKLISNDSFIFVFLIERFLCCGIPKHSYFSSSNLLSVKHSCKVVNNICQWVPSSNLGLSFWHDNWLGYSIVDRIGVHYKARKALHAFVSDLRLNGSWNMSFDLISQHADIAPDIHRLVLSRRDVYVYRVSPDGKANVKIFYKTLTAATPKVSWGSDLWHHYIPPSHSILT